MATMRTIEEPGTMPTPEEIFRACDHAGPRDAELKRSTTGETLRACWQCGNAAIGAHRAMRKAQLAARPKDCARCGKRPHTYTWGGYRLCGGCLRVTRAEHQTNAARAGVMALFATGAMISTTDWAMARKET